MSKEQAKNSIYQFVIELEPYEKYSDISILMNIDEYKDFVNFTINKDIIGWALFEVDGKLYIGKNTVLYNKGKKIYLGYETEDKEVLTEEINTKLYKTMGIAVAIKPMSEILA